MSVKSITIYSTETCPYCKLEKKWLDQNKVKYTNYFVDQDAARADEMIRKSGQMGVPVTELTLANGKNEIVVGFDKERLSEAIGIK